MRKLGKELKALQSRTRLPLHAAAAIFLRYDSERIDKMRAIISGAQRDQSITEQPIDRHEAFQVNGACSQPFFCAKTLGACTM